MTEDNDFTGRFEIIMKSEGDIHYEVRADNSNEVIAMLMALITVNREKIENLGYSVEGLTSEMRELVRRYEKVDPDAREWLTRTFPEFYNKE